MVLTHSGNGVQLPSGKHVAVRESSGDMLPSSKKWYPSRHSKVTVAFAWYHISPSKVLFSLPLATCGCGQRTERKTHSRKQLSKRDIIMQAEKNTKKFVKIEPVQMILNLWSCEKKKH